MSTLLHRLPRRSLRTEATSSNPLRNVLKFLMETSEVAVRHQFAAPWRDTRAPDVR